MNLRTIILAFLAARYPAAYDETAILQRVNKSGLLDTPAPADLVRRGAPHPCPIAGSLLSRNSTACPATSFWTATEAGKIEWARSGQLHVG